MRRLVAALALVIAATATGCGGESAAPESAAGDALQYLPKDAGAVMLLSTDLESDQWQRFDRQVFQRFGQGSVENLLEESVEGEGNISYDDDVKPLLGNDLVFGTLGEARDLFGDDGDEEDGGFVGALEVPDGDRAASALEKGGFERTGEESGATLFRNDEGEVAAVEGDVVIAADDRETLLRALAVRDDGEGLTDDDLGARLDGVPGDALLRGSAILTT